MSIPAVEGSTETKNNRALGMHAREPGLHTYSRLSPALRPKYPGYDFLIICFGLRTQHFLIQLNNTVN